METQPQFSDAQIEIQGIYSYPKIRWYNFFPHAFKELKGKQLQRMINPHEELGNVIEEIYHSPFMHFVKVKGEQ